ncbi:MAG: S8 family serine peptidase, partial [Defluviitaleaceae bacterium]|nr:S8 family serine peptidase [Defluviitaleaceae bacterium]
MNKRKFDKKVTLSLAVLLFFLSIPTNVLAEGRTIQLPSSSVLYESSELFSDVLLPDLHYVHEEDEEASQSTYQFNPEELLINEDLIPQGFDDYSNIGRRGNGRLIGFDGPNALANDDSLIPVIVIFNQDPIAVQLARAAERGIAPRFDVATLVERERQLFYYELDELSVSLSSHNPLARNLHNSFTITREFSQAFNGVSMTLPSHMVSYLAAFQSVAMVFPDEILQLDPIIEHDPLEEDLIAFSANNPAGVRLGRERMNAHILHEMGIRGQGLLMAVIDTGLYYYHPAFEGSFPTASDMAARGVSIPDDYLLYLDGQGYFFVGRDMLHNLAGGSWMNNPEGNDPMETSPMNFPNASGSWSRHGTHVAAIALGRETNGMIGLAPEALGIHYRVLGPGGGTNSDILAAMEHAAYYMRVDIINLSLGPTGATPLLEPLTITINNLSISTDAIFVVAAGNSGSNYNTSWGGGNSSFAINVANFAETPARSGMYLSSDSLDDAELSFFSGSLSIRELQNGNLVSTAPGSAYTEVGEMRIFALPATPGSPYGAGLDAETAPNVGAGTLNDFEALEAYYGREALLGGWLLVRRGEPFVVTASRAESLNMAGVILINTPTQAMIIASGDDYSLPLVATHSADGRTLLANILASNTDYAMFTLTGFTNSNIPLRVALGSSRGPAPTSFEINPEIGAHGSTVIAAVPPWDVGWSLSPNTADVTFHANGGNILPSEFIFNADERSSFYDRSYLPLSGTSMASPMVAGGVALMLQYNRENSSRDWNRSEIRARITNNAIPVHHAEQATGLAPAAGVFEAGAGQADLLAAIQNDTVVLGYFDAILSITETTPVRTGAFSFGGVNLHYAQGSSATSSLEAVIINTSNQARTYTFDYSHITNARRSVVGSTLNLPPSVTVPANSETNFSIEIDIPIDLPLGHHEGFVEVLLGATVVARIPFAAVTYYDYTPPALVHDAFLARSIFSANPDRQNTLGAQLQTYATIYDTFWGDLYIFGIDEYGNEVIMPGIGDDFGFIGERDSPQSINEARVRYAVNLLTIPDDPTIWVEGDYVAKWVISHPGSGEHDITHMLYFSIDNTPPEFTNVEVSQANEGITVTGTVNDAFLNEAASRGMTNDIWLTNSEITLANSLAVWALAGTNTENNRPIRATVQNNGRFSVNLPEATMDSSITLWAIDNYTPMPHIFNQLHDNTSVSNFTRQDYFIPNGLLIADAYADYLAFGYRLGGGLLTTPNTSF